MGLSKESPGASVRDHEELHVWDWQVAYSPSALNQAFPTEGYCSPQECNNARGNFDTAWKNYFYQAQADTEKQDAR